MTRPGDRPQDAVDALSTGCGRIRTVTETLDPTIARRLRRDRDGLIAAVVRQYDTGEVLMLAWMNDEALGAPWTPVVRPTGRAAASSTG